MQTADNVKFGYGFRVSGGGGLKSLFQRHSVSAGRVFLASKGAEAARGHADIRGIEVAVEIEVRHIAVHALAHMVRQPAHGENVRRAIERDRIVQTQPFAGKDLFGDRFQTCLVSLKTVARHIGNSCGHEPLIITEVGDWFTRKPQHRGTEGTEGTEIGNYTTR